MKYILLYRPGEECLVKEDCSVDKWVTILDEYDMLWYCFFKCYSTLSLFVEKLGCILLFPFKGVYFWCILCALFLIISRTSSSVSFSSSSSMSKFSSLSTYDGSLFLSSSYSMFYSPLVIGLIYLNSISN
jgi:hypothetical protein